MKPLMKPGELPDKFEMHLDDATPGGPDATPGGPDEEGYIQPQTAYCSKNHMMHLINKSPYPYKTKINCDICKTPIDIDASHFLYHCRECQIDFCINCGFMRMR